MNAELNNFWEARSPGLRRAHPDEHTTVAPRPPSMPLSNQIVRFPHDSFSQGTRKQLRVVDKQSPGELTADQVLNS